MIDFGPAGALVVWLSMLAECPLLLLKCNVQTSIWDTVFVLHLATVEYRLLYSFSTSPQEVNKYTTNCKLLSEFCIRTQKSMITCQHKANHRTVLG